MKFAQITQLFLTLLGTIAAAKADDAPYGSGFYYDNKVFLDFVLPNSNFTEVSIWPLNAGKFSYDIDMVFGVYSPANTLFDVRPDTGTSMEADLVFEDGDISANMSMVGELTTPFFEDVLEFNVLLQNVEMNDDQEFVVSITVTSLGSSPTSSTP